MYSDEIKSSELAKKLLVFDLVYLDTCSLMEDSFPLFMDLLVKSRYYWKDKVKVIILSEVYAELTKHAANTTKTHLTVSAKRALKILKHDSWRLWRKTIQINKKKDTDGFADNAIFSEVSINRIKKKVLVITQDKTLATDLKKQNSLDSSRGRFVLIYKINQRGELEENLGNPTDNQSKFKKPNGISSAPVKNAQNQQKQKPVVPQNKETAPTPSIQAILKNDKRIAANLNNQNYPADKKIKDLEEQISLLSKEDKKSVEGLKLSYDLDKLRKSLESLKKPAKVQETVEVQPDNKKQVKKPAPSKNETKDVWYEFGNTPYEAAINACTHLSIIPHRKDVPYIKEGHGEANIIIEELSDRIASGDFSGEGAKLDVKFDGIVIHIIKTSKDFKASLEKVVVLPKKNAPKKKETAVEEPVKVAPAVEEVKPAESAPSPMEKAKSSTPKKKAPKKAETKADEVKDEAKAESKVEEKAKAPKKEAVSAELKKALEIEKPLKCNVQNPNYPLKSKIADLEAQLERARNLKESERRKLTWGIRELQKRLSELKKD
ncbi:MAG: hypothetical protein MJ238_00285 [Bacilli bacterium]|nr:hypothetical protein [Bacilli bacterium]